MAVAGRDSLWGGMSGAAVLSGPWLVAVVASTVANYGTDRLSATLIEPALRDPSFLELLHAEGCSTELDQADLPLALQIPYRSKGAGSRGAPRSLVRLLQPKYEVMPFVGRSHEIDELSDWCEQDERFGVHLLVGPGGQGKTRLALKFCQAMESMGWLAGTLTGPDYIDDLLARPMPLLIVVDWADTHVQEVVSLAQRAPTATAAPIRLLLIARSAGSWWTSLPYRVGDLADEAFEAASVTELDSLTDSMHERQAQFWSAVDTLAPLLNAEKQSTIEPDLTPDSFSNVLMVHLAALVALKGSVNAPSAESSGQSLISELLRREDASYWEPSAPTALRGDHAAITRRRAVAVATLTGAATEDDGRRALQTLPDFMAADPSPALYWLRGLYPSDGYLGPLHPDLLGERLVSEVVRERPDLPLRLLPESEKAWTIRLLTVLAQASRSNVNLVPSVTGLLESRMGALVAQARKGADVSLGHALALALSQTQSATLARELEQLLENQEWSMALTEARVAGYRLRLEGGPETLERPYLLGSLAIELSRLGRTEEALATSQDAIAVLRSLTTSDASVRVTLAIVLHNMAGDLVSSGRFEDALTLIDQSIAILREYGSSDSTVTSAVAKCLSLRSTSLTSLGHMTEAREDMQNALGTMRELAAKEPGYRHDMARLLLDWAAVQQAWGPSTEAVDATDEAVGIYMQLESEDIDTYLKSRAAGLVRASSLYAYSDKLEKALTTISVALPLCRRLDGISPLRYRWMLVQTLGVEADVLQNMSRNAEALQPRREVVETIRAIESSDAVPEPSEQIHALIAYASTLLNVGQEDEARRALHEAATLEVTAPGQINSQRAAQDLVIESQLLERLNRPREAMLAVDRALHLYRALLRKRPDAFRAALTRALSQQATILLKLGRRLDAIASLDEAIDVSRPLASEHPQAFSAFLSAAYQKADYLEEEGNDIAANEIRRDAGETPMPTGVALFIPDLEVPGEIGTGDGKGYTYKVERHDPAELRRKYTAAADAGDVEAQFNLGSLLADWFEPPELEEARHWYTAAAEAGNTRAQVNLGYLLSERADYPADLAEARRWYTVAAEASDNMARANLGYLLGWLIDPPDLVEARRWYTAAAEAGDIRAQFNLGILLAERIDPPDLQEARHWYTAAAEASDTSAQFNLGTLLAERLDPPDLLEARRWYKAAAEAGDIKAQNYLGELLSDRLDPPELDEARRWYTAAAAAGDTKAQFNLGYLLSRQMDPPDLVAARPWYTAAAEAGDTNAQFSLGYLLAEQLDPPDLLEARRWYTAAAEAGDTNAQFSIGYLLAEQLDPPDLLEARRWYTAAAEAGDTNAQFSLGYLLAEQLDPPDLLEARRWYTAAAEAGSTRAQINLGYLLSE